MRGGGKQNKNQRPLRTTVQTLVIIVTRAQGSASPHPPQSWLSPPGPEAGKGRGEGGGAPCTHFHQRALSGTRERRKQLLVLLDSKLDIARVGRKEGDKVMKMGHRSHQPGSQGDLRCLAPSPCSVPTPQLPLSPGSAPGGHLHRAVPSQAWLQRQLVGMKRGGGVGSPRPVLRVGGKYQLPYRSPCYVPGLVLGASHI